MPHRRSLRDSAFEVSGFGITGAGVEKRYAEVIHEILIVEKCAAGRNHKVTL